MASVPMDALTSFVYLNDHLPTWISEINNLAAQVVTKREEFTAEYRRVLEQARPKRKKSPSVTSVKTNEKQSSIGSQKNDKISRNVLALARPTEISPLDPENKYLFANARRGKRRQGTSFRSVASGPQTFRNQHEVIIYYDSSLQNSFEGLVKGIGTARNNLRKGKQARALERGLRLPSFGPGNHGRTQRASLLLSSPQKSSLSSEIMLGSKRLPNDVPFDDDASFTEISKDLEAAQALCETAAHQFLRDGDCTLEIDRIREHFEKVSKLAKLQIDILEKEKDGPAMDIDTEAKTTESAMRQGDIDMATTVAAKLGVNVTHSVNTGAMEIEADSDDEVTEEDMVIDISRFRGARSLGLRA